MTNLDQYRPELFDIAQRLLGDRIEAESVVREALFKVRNVSAVDEPRAWLSRVVTRMCIERFEKTRARRHR